MRGGSPAVFINQESPLFFASTTVIEISIAFIRNQVHITAFTCRLADCAMDFQSTSLILSSISCRIVRILLYYIERNVSRDSKWRKSFKVKLNTRYSDNRMDINQSVYTVAVLRNKTAFWTYQSRRQVT